MNIETKPSGSSSKEVERDNYYGKTHPVIELRYTRGDLS
jgi:hypothetical protein